MSLLKFATGSNGGCAGGVHINCPKAEGTFPTFAVSVTVFVAVSIIDTVSLFQFATYTLFPSGVTETPRGFPSTFTVASTLLVAVSITETLLLSQLVTYTFVPAGLIATPSGQAPTSTVAMIVFVAVSITETVS